MRNWKPAAVACCIGCLVIAAIIGTALASEDAGKETWGDLQKLRQKRISGRS